MSPSRYATNPESVATVKATSQAQIRCNTRFDIDVLLSKLLVIRTGSSVHVKILAGSRVTSNEKGAVVLQLQSTWLGRTPASRLYPQLDFALPQGLSIARSIRTAKRSTLMKHKHYLSMNAMNVSRALISLRLQLAPQITALGQLTSTPDPGHCHSIFTSKRDPHNTQSRRRSLACRHTAHQIVSLVRLPDQTAVLHFCLDYLHAYPTKHQT